MKKDWRYYFFWLKVNTKLNRYKTNGITQTSGTDPSSRVTAFETASMNPEGMALRRIHLIMVPILIRVERREAELVFSDFWLTFFQQNQAMKTYNI